MSKSPDKSVNVYTLENKRKGDKKMLIYNLYALFDKRAKTVGVPFIAVNDEVARFRATKTVEKMKEAIEEIRQEDYTVLNLGRYRTDIVINYDSNGNISSYDNNIINNNDIYDINNLNVGRRPRKVEFEEMSEKEIEKLQEEYIKLSKEEK